MKYASYILSIIGVVLLLNIFLSYSSDSYRAFLRDTKTRMVGVSKEDALEKMNKDQIEINSKILNSIDKLNENLDKLKERSKAEATEISTGASMSGGMTEPGAEIPETPKSSLLDIPKTLSSKLGNAFELKQIENAGIFGIKDEKLFDKVQYSTHYNFKRRLNVYVFDKDYKTMMSNIKLANIYKVNETDNFFGFTFYLNPLKPDNKTRFVTLIEGVAVGFEIEKPFYESLKKNLQK